MASTLRQKKVAKKYDFIEQWLPTRYTKDVNTLLGKDKKDAAYIRQVKNERINNQKIMKALYTVAKLNKLQLEN